MHIQKNKKIYVRKAFKFFSFKAIQSLLNSYHKYFLYFNQQPFKHCTLHN